AAVQDPGAAVQDPGAAVQDPGAAVQDPGAAVQDPGAAVQVSGESAGGRPVGRADTAVKRVAAFSVPADMTASRATASAGRATGEAERTPAQRPAMTDRAPSGEGRSAPARPQPGSVTPDEDMPDWVKGRPVDTVAIGTPRSSSAPVGARG
ncbi:hypothetical protein ACWCXH_35270, partial [Kitasatospora sp. NPDC001660]